MRWKSVGLFVVVLVALVVPGGTALAASGSGVYSWGAVDNLTTAEYNSPTSITGIPGTVVQIATSNSDTYALTSSGEVWAWGYARYGSLGDGTQSDTYTSTPVRVAFPAGTVIASLPNPMPYNSGLAIDTSGNVWGWGMDQSYALCSRKTSILTPIELSPKNVTLASGAGDHTLFYANGVLEACGKNEYGELGNGTFTSSRTPVAVIGLPSEPVTSLVTSWQDSGALLSDGTYWDWGYNAAQQLGDGTTQASDVPEEVALPDSSPVSQVSLGGSNETDGQTIALLADGAVYTWGSNAWGQLGTTDTKGGSGPRTVPFPAGTSISSVLSGGSTEYAVDSSGNVWAWGDNQLGQVGDGTTKSVSSPTSIGLTCPTVSATASNVAASC